jgi:hypothetical protein
MGSSPKQSDYAPSEAEKASAAVAMAEYNHFKKEYDPLLREMRDESKSESAKSTLRGRTNADTMQALTNNMTYGQTQSNNLSSDMSQAYQSQLGQANARAKDIQNKMASNVLGTARGQAADAQSGMAQASRLATSEALTRAKANQDVRQAKLNAAVELGTKAATAGASNLASGGTFFTPNTAGAGNPVQLASGAKQRLNFSKQAGTF